MSLPLFCDEGVYFESLLIYSLVPFLGGFYMVKCAPLIPLENTSAAVIKRLAT